MFETLYFITNVIMTVFTILIVIFSAFVVMKMRSLKEIHKQILQHLYVIIIFIAILRLVVEIIIGQFNVISILAIIYLGLNYLFAYLLMNEKSN